MFRAAELGRKVPKSEFNQREPVLRQELLDSQRALSDLGKFPVIILFAGVDGAGKEDTINLLNEWMDPRWMVTRAYDAPSVEERERPAYWRFWRDLPPNGQIGLFLSSWYSRPVLDAVNNKIDDAEFDRQLDRIIHFENALAEDDALILKFWMHLSRDEQKRRLKKLEKDPLSNWQVSQKDWDNWRIYDRFESAAERTIRRTSTGLAPWSIIEGSDLYYRSLTVGTMIRDAINRQIEKIRTRELRKAAVPAPAPAAPEPAATDSPPEPPPLHHITVLSQLDMQQDIGKKEYQRELKKYQGQLHQLHMRALKKKISTILVLEGPDAAGKGGAIRRITRALNARHFQVIPIAAPTDEEAAHHYLWRFWRHLSRAGRITIFDRSWYGRVLVERIEGFASEHEWKRAYSEVNDFEEQLTEHGIVLLKYWIHITKDEQLARFKAREETPHKRWKLTDDDWRNRERWAEYERAVNDIVEHTSGRNAPWILVEGNSKRYARIKAIKTLCEALERTLASHK